MGDQDIQSPPVIHTVQPQAGKHAERPQVGFRLGILVRAIRSVADAAAKPSHQVSSVAGTLEVQVGAAIHAGEGVLGIVVGIVIARHVQQWDIDDCQQILEILVREISAAQDKLDFIEMSVRAQAV